MNNLTTLLTSENRAEGSSNPIIVNNYTVSVRSSRLQSFLQINRTGGPITVTESIRLANMGILVKHENVSPFMEILQEIGKVRAELYRLMVETNSKLLKHNQINQALMGYCDIVTYVQAAALYNNNVGMEIPTETRNRVAELLHLSNENDLLQEYSFTDPKLVNILVKNKSMHQIAVKLPLTQYDFCTVVKSILDKQADVLLDKLNQFSGVTYLIPYIKNSLLKIKFLIVPEINNSQLLSLQQHHIVENNQTQFTCSAPAGANYSKTIIMRLRLALEKEDKLHSLENDQQEKFYFAYPGSSLLVPRPSTRNYVSRQILDMTVFAALMYTNYLATGAFQQKKAFYPSIQEYPLWAYVILGFSLANLFIGTIRHFARTEANCYLEQIDKLHGDEECLSDTRNVIKHDAMKLLYDVAEHQYPVQHYIDSLEYVCQRAGHSMLFTLRRILVCLTILWQTGVADIYNSRQKNNAILNAVLQRENKINIKEETLIRRILSIDNHNLSAVQAAKLELLLRHGNINKVNPSRNNLFKPFKELFINEISYSMLNQLVCMGPQGTIAVAISLYFAVASMTEPDSFAYAFGKVFSQGQMMISFSSMVMFFTLAVNFVPSGVKTNGHRLANYVYENFAPLSSTLSALYVIAWLAQDNIRFLHDEVSSKSGDISLFFIITIFVKSALSLSLFLFSEKGDSVFSEMLISGAHVSGLFIAAAIVTSCSIFSRCISGNEHINLGVACDLLSQALKKVLALISTTTIELFTEFIYPGLEMLGYGLYMSVSNCRVYPIAMLHAMRNCLQDSTSERLLADDDVIAGFSYNTGTL